MTDERQATNDGDEAAAFSAGPDTRAPDSFIVKMNRAGRRAVDAIGGRAIRLADEGYPNLRSAQQAAGEIASLVTENEGRWIMRTAGGF